MPVRSLVDLASIACIKNIRQLDSVGDYLPYENVRHILLKVENAHQLREIELNSPQIEGRTGEIWLKLIEKDFPLEFRAKAYKPQNPSKWFKVWEKYKKEHDKSVEDSERKLKNAMMGIKQEQTRNTSMIVERKLLPRKGATGPARRGHRDNTSSSLNFTSGSRTKTLSGASVMRKVRREAGEIASIKGSLSRSIGIPQRQTGSYSGVSKAPQSLIDERRRASQPANAPSTATPTKPKVPAAVSEHEHRATFISDSDEDDDEDERREWRPTKQAAARPMARPVPKAAPARSAAASLLKTRRAASSDSKPRLVNASSSPTKSSSSSGPKTQSAAAGTSATPQSKVAEKTSLRSTPRPLPSRSQGSPTSQSRSGPSSPPPPEAASPPRPPKRKAPDIFMRPKKRPQPH